MVSKGIAEINSPNYALFVGNWCIKWHFGTKTKACNQLICRLLVYFDIETGGERGTNTFKI